MFTENCAIADVFIAPNLPDFYRRNVSESMSQVLQVATMYYPPALCLSHYILYDVLKICSFLPLLQ